MAAGDTLVGRRLPDGSRIAELSQPGDYFRTGGCIVWGITPNGCTIRTDERWGLEEHDDGTLSIVPASPGAAHSIMVNRPPDSDRETWHGYLERGTWREV